MKPPDAHAGAKVVRVLCGNYMLLANLHGYVFNKNVNYFAMFDGKSKLELEYFAVHGYWPNNTDPDPAPVQ